MGLALEHVQSDRNHYVSFICQICNNLAELDAMVTGGCSHAFCRSCLNDWTSKSRECPACKSSLEIPNDGPQSCSSCRTFTSTSGMDLCPLQIAQPLAHACMTKIQISCPHCKNWVGDYGLFHEHLRDCTSKIRVEESKERSLPPNGQVNGSSQPGNETSLSSAATLKEKGNAKFNKGDYGEARAYYDGAVEILSEVKLSSSEDRQAAASLYCNRGATHAKERKYDKALVDYDCALRIAPDFQKAYSRKFKALSSMGLLQEGKSCLEAAVANIPQDKTLLEDLRKIKQIIDGIDMTRRFLQRQNFDEAKESGEFLMTITDHIDAVLLSAEADASVGQIDTAIEKCDFILSKNSNHVLALKTKGYAHLFGSKLDAALLILKEAVKYDREGNSSVKETFKLCRKVHSDLALSRSSINNKSENSRTNLKQAFDCYSALIADNSIPPKTPLKCLLYVERGEVAYQLQQYQTAISDANLAIEINPRSVRALVVQCDSLIGSGRVVEARDTLREIKRDWGCDNEKIKKAYLRADFECKILETDKQLRSMVSEKRKPDSNLFSEKRQEGRSRRNPPPQNNLGADREMKRKNRTATKKHSEPRAGRGKKELSPTPDKMKNGSKGLIRNKSRVKERPIERHVMSEEDARRRMSMI